MHNYSRHASVTTMLQHLHLPTLQQRRQHSKIIMLYRITHKLASISTATYIAPSTRNTQHYILPYARTHEFKTSFFPSTIKIWNNLQPVITNSTTIPQLRQALQSTPPSGRRGAPCSAGSEWTPQAYLHHLHIMYNQIAIQPQNIKSRNQSPTHHPVGVGLHAQPGLSGHLTLTSIIQLPYTNTPTSCRRGQTDRQTDRTFISINHSLFAITMSQPNINTPIPFTIIIIL